jgi:hypothetical protein
MRSLLILATGVVATTSASYGQEAVPPQLLADTFIEVCQTAFADYQHAVSSLLTAGWQTAPSSQQDDQLQSLELVNPDRSIKASLQNFAFGPGTFEQCAVEAYASFSEADVAEALKRFPSAKGKILTNNNGSHSGLWLLTDQPNFTSLNIIYDEHAASIITMRTSYAGPAGVQQ